MNGKISNIFIIIISFILICSGVTINKETMESAQNRIIEEQVADKEEVTEAIIMEDEMMMEGMGEGEPVGVEIEEETNSYNAKELATIIVSSSLIALCVVNILFALLVYHKVIDHPYGILGTLMYCMLIISLASVTSIFTIVKSDKLLLNGEQIEVETQRKEHAAYLVKESIDEENKELQADEDDESVIKITKQSTYNGTNLSLLKEKGDVSLLEDNLIVGLNNTLIAEESSNVFISNSTITSNAKNSSTIFTTDTNTSLTLENVTLVTNEENSKNIIAQDNSEITISNSKLTTNKKTSELFYSSSKITVDNVEANTVSNFASLIGTNKLTITNSKLTSDVNEEYKGMFIVESKEEGSSSITNAELTIENSNVRVNNASEYYNKIPLFYVYDTNTKINLTKNNLSYGSGILLNVESKEGSSNKNTVFTITDSIIRGHIYSDKNSAIRINLNNAIYYGSINNNNTSQYIDISLDKTSTWYLTGNSYVNTITIQKQNNITKYIKSNGYNIYYNSKNNEWLNNRTIRLQGGGKLIPVK